ncbi:MAG: Flp family type IVb pilin [Roseiarcus sp.]|jgi:pilus assembly protein Flp/PilA
MLARITTFANDKRGATAIEYALLCGLIAIFMVGSLSALGTSISSEFSEVDVAMK